MPSSYTANLGIEKIGSGEQAGTWGTTTNLNFDIIDQAVNGVTSIALSGTTSTLLTDNGVLSEGGNKVLVFTGSLSSGHTVTISPNNQDKMYFVQNDSGQTLTFIQGTGGTTGNNRAVEIPNGAKGQIYADGGGSGAIVSDLLANPSFGGTKVTSSEIGLLSGATTVGTDAVAADDGILTNDNGTMKQTKASTFSTYFNSNLVEVKSALALTDSNQTVTASGATSVYQRVTSDGAHTLKIAITNLVVGQYVIIDKTTSANSVTLDWTNNSAVTSSGISLGTSVEFAIGIYNGTGFSFTETIKF